MRITIVLGAFFPVPPIMGGAVEKVWFALGQEFARRGHEVVQISRTHSTLPQTENIEGVTHIRVPGFSQPRSMIWLKFLDLIYSWRVRRRLTASRHSCYQYILASASRTHAQSRACLRARPARAKRTNAMVRPRRAIACSLARHRRRNHRGSPTVARQGSCNSKRAALSS